MRQSLELLGTRRFGTYWVATLLSNIGFWAQEVAEPWLLLSIGASSFLVGLDAFVADAPAWLLTPAGGYLADHYDRRRVITLFQSIQFLCPVLLVVLLLTGALQAWMVIVLSLVVGVTDALSMPSYQSIVPSIVEHEQIAAGLALRSTQYNLSRILGPAVAGGLIAAVGVVGCFAINAASYVPFIAVALWILPRKARVEAKQARVPAVRARVHALAAMRVVLRDPYIRGALLLVFATSLLCGPLLTFTPVLVRDGFGGGAGGFSLAIGAFGAGGLGGVGLLLALDPTHDRRPFGAACAVAYAGTVIAAALDPWAWALPVLTLFGGALPTISNTTANTLLQTTATPAIRGQTVSLYMLAIRGGMAVGSLATGVATATLGVRTALLIDGSLAVVVVSVLGWQWTRAPAPARAAA